MLDSTVLAQFLRHSWETEIQMKEMPNMWIVQLNSVCECVCGCMYVVAGLGGLIINLKQRGGTQLVLYFATFVYLFIKYLKDPNQTRFNAPVFHFYVLRI